MRMKAATAKQTMLDVTTGHCFWLMPNVTHKANPRTVSEYMPVDMSSVFRERMIFHACGKKLAVETMAARYPTIIPNITLSTNGRSSEQSSMRKKSSACSGRSYLCHQSIHLLYVLWVVM